jgi:hypothetical protein
VCRCGSTVGILVWRHCPGGEHIRNRPDPGGIERVGRVHKLGSRGWRLTFRRRRPMEWCFGRSGCRSRRRALVLVRKRSCTRHLREPRAAITWTSSTQRPVQSWRNDSRMVGQVRRGRAPGQVGSCLDKTYQYGPGRGLGSAENMVDIDIYNSSGQLRRGIVTSDPDYGGGDQWSVAGSTLSGCR